MYVQTKKVVIIFIVTIITSLSIIVSLYSNNHEQVSISVITAEELAFNNSFAQNIFNNISVSGVNGESKNKLRSVASIYQIDDDREYQFDNVVSSSNINVIFGDQFNAYINDALQAYPNSQFILIENSMEFTADNVFQLSIDYEQLFSYIDSNTSEENKSLLIIATEFSSLGYDKFINSKYANNTNIKLINVQDTSENVKIRNDVDDALSHGFTNVYVLDPYNNQVVLNAVEEYNESLTVASETQSSETSEVKSSETSKTQSNDTSKEIDDIVPASLIYLALNETEREQGEYYEYAISISYNSFEEIEKVIESNLQGNVVSDSKSYSLMSK